MNTFDMKCKNCNTTINENSTYCHACGQKVEELLSTRSLFSKTISSYFSVDSRIARSIKPLIFKPGYLATKFVDGKRVFYLHPTQFYLILSVLFFFLFSFTIKEYQQRADASLEKIFTPEKTRNINKYNAKGEVTFVFEKQKVDSLIAAKAPKELLLHYFGLTKQDTWFKKMMYSQLLKIYSRRGAGILKVFYSTVSMTLLILIPIFALLLKLLFYKKGALSHHLVFAFYYFSFLFLMFNLILIAKFFIPIPGWIILITVCISVAHLLIGIMKFYRKSFKIALFKTSILLVSFFVIVLPITVSVLGFITLLIF